MLKDIKKLLKDKIIYVAILAAIGIAVFSLIKVTIPEVKVSHSDKIAHVTAYFILGLLWFLAISKKGMKIAVFLTVIFFGVLLEILQLQLTSFRTFEYLDILANATGVILALLVIIIMEKKDFKLLNSL